MKKLTVLFLIVHSCVCWSQQMSHRLNNQDIIDMVALGISDDVIITKVHSAAKPEDLAFDTSADGLKALKAGKVSDAVIKVMINPAPSASITVVPAAAAPAVVTNDPNLPPPEVGVYW